MILKIPKSLESDIATSLFFNDLLNEITSPIKYFGPKDENGTWKIDVSSGDMVISKLESGVFVVKDTILS